MSTSGNYRWWENEGAIKRIYTEVLASKIKPKSRAGPHDQKVSIATCTSLQSQSKETKSEKQEMPAEWNRKHIKNTKFVRNDLEIKGLDEDNEHCVGQKGEKSMNEKLDKLVSAIEELYATRLRLMTDYGERKRLNEDLQKSIKLARKIKDYSDEIESIRKSLCDFQSNIQSLRNEIQNDGNSED